MTSMLIASLLLSAPSDTVVGNNSSVGGASSAASMTSAAAVTGQTFSSPLVATDSLPATVTIKATNAYSQATGANRTGADLVLSGGLPSTLLTVASKAASTGDTLTFARTISGVTPANVVWTEGTAYDCAAAGSNAACALAIYTYCNANKPSGVQGCYCTDGTCSDAKVFIRWTDSTVVNASVTSSDDAGIDDNSTLALSAGRIRLTAVSTASGAVQYPLCVGGATGTTYLEATDCAGTSKSVYGAALKSGSYADMTTYSQVGAASYYAFSGRARMYSPADGYIKITNSGGGIGAWQNYPQTTTCSDSGNGSHSACGGANSNQIYSNIVQWICEDADGCSVSLSLIETSWSATAVGIVYFIGPPANHIDIDDRAGVIETTGGATVTMDALDVLPLVYAPNAAAWVQAGPLAAN